MGAGQAEPAAALAIRWLGSAVLIGGRSAALAVGMVAGLAADLAAAVEMLRSGHNFGHSDSVREKDTRVSGPCASSSLSLLEDL